MAHQQKSFHPFPSRYVSPAFFQTAKRKLCLAGTSWPCGLNPQTTGFKPAWLLPGFKSQHESSSVTPFLTLPTVGYTCQHSHSFQPFWAAIVSLGRCGPMTRSNPSPSSHAGAVTRGSCHPVTKWVKVTPISLAQSMAIAT